MHNQPKIDKPSTLPNPGSPARARDCVRREGTLSLLTSAVLALVCCLPTRSDSSVTAGAPAGDDPGPIGARIESLDAIDPTPRVTSGPVTNVANGHLYYGLSQGSWTKAEAEAVRLGGHLVTLNDSTENDWVHDHFLTGYSNHYQIWIGLTDQGTEGHWVWASGETTDYFNLPSGPINDDRDYGMMFYYERDQWHDAPDETPDYLTQNMAVVEISPLEADQWQWIIGVRNSIPGHAEFAIENGRADPGPGKVTRLPGDPQYVTASNPTADDDFYFGGLYPIGFNGLAQSLQVPNTEPSVAWERALTTSDRTNRMHFHLTPSQVAPGARLRLRFRISSGGGMLNGLPIPGFGSHRIAIRLRGGSGPVEIAPPTLITGQNELTFDFSPEAVGARSGPNTLEFERIGPTIPGALQFVIFDYVQLEQLTPVPNLPPVLASVPNQQLAPGSTLQLQWVAADDSTPVGSLTFWKVSGPAGLTVSSSGVLEWSTSCDVAPGDYPVEVAVIDDGSPAGISRSSFQVSILPGVGIPRPSIASDFGSQEKPIRVNGTALLESTACGPDGPFTYQWYQGTAGDLSNPVGQGGKFLTTPRLRDSTPFWVRATNSKGVLGDSAAVIVAVHPPPPGGEPPPPIPAPQFDEWVQLPLRPDQSFTLQLHLPPMPGEIRYEWFQGESGDISLPLRSYDDEGFPTGGYSTWFGLQYGLRRSTKYWVRISNLSGTSDSPAVEVWVENLAMEVGEPDCSSGEMLVPLRTRTFRQITSFQGTVRWDPAAAVLVGVAPGLLPDLLEDNLHVNPEDGTLGIIWWNRHPGTDFVSFPEQEDGTVLCYLRFRLLGMWGTSTPLELVNEPTPWKAFGSSSLGEGSPTPVDLKSGVLVNTCSGTTASGRVTYLDTGRAMPGVILGVSLYAKDGPWSDPVTTAVTDSEGGYRIAIPIDDGFTGWHLRWNGPSPASNEGITMADWWLIREHVLGLQTLTGPLELLTSDADGDSNISVEDLRRVFEIILGRRPSSWTLLASNFSPEDPREPWSWRDEHYLYYEYDYPGTDFGHSELPGRDFKLMKTGDVNGDWGQSSPTIPALDTRSSVRTSEPSVQLEVDQRAANTGDTVILRVRSSAVNRLTTAQFSLHWNPAVLRFNGVVEKNLRGMTDAHFGTEHSRDGSLVFAWGDPVADGVLLDAGQTLFSVAYTVVGDAGNSSPVRIESLPIPAELTVGGRVTPFATREGFVATRRTDGGVLGLLPPGAEGVGLWFEMPTEGKWVLESSENLKEWVPQTTPAAVSGEGLNRVQIPDHGDDRRFYRVTFLP